MWYILYMNKDVIYIEPEDDITDIISKVENSKSKIVALVPPKKAGVFRSVVNIKLIAKAGMSAEKSVVLVTTDPSIVKLAAATKLPVTKNLQSAPAVPKEDVDIAEEETSKEELEEKPDDEAEDEKKEEAKPVEDEETAEDEEDESKEEETKKPKKAAKVKKSGNPVISWIAEHKKLSIAGGIGAVVLVLVLIWALVLAPSVSVTVAIRTDTNNFSENVSFVTKLEEENSSEGKFFLEEKKIESTQEVEFEATGQKNVGETASGEVKIYAYFPLNIKASTQIAEGDTFTISGLSFKATKSVVLSYSGEGKSDCANKDNSAGLVDYGCRINGSVPVMAVESGAKYNIAASSTGWDTTARVFAYSDSAMSGGSDRVIKIVQQSDIDKAKAGLTSENESENKAKLYEDLDDDLLVIDSSFKQETSDAVSTPAVGEEVKDETKPKLKATTTARVYVIDKTKVKEFITEKADIKDDRSIYEMKDPFIENFMKTDGGYTGKLKTSYLTGPRLTVTSIVDLIKGHGLGDAQHLLKDIDGVKEVKMDPSFPWVTSVPGDSNKITVNLEIEDQDGHKVEKPSEEEKKGETDKKSDTETENSEKE